MANGMATVAERDEVGGVVIPADRAGDEVVDVELAGAWRRAAGAASVIIALEDGLADVAPRLSGRRLLRHHMATRP